MCELNPTILLINSVLKPFITDITIINVATPMHMPVNENHEIIDKRLPKRRGLKYLNAINLSKVLNGTAFFYFLNKVW